jgi:hypothetical protein
VTVTTERAAEASGTILLTLASAQFLMTLDSSVMNVSIATVASDVGTTVAGIQTAITMYTLVMASLMITGGKDNPAVPEQLSSRGQVELTAGVPFISDRDLDDALEAVGVDGAAADAIVDENADARINGLRAALSVLALMALAALCFSYALPTRQPGADASGNRDT